MAIEESVDEVKVAGTATPGADCQLAGHMCVGASSEGRHFLVADVDPPDGFLSSYLVGYPIERIADYSKDPLNSSRGERGYEAFCYRRHNFFPPS
jgi:hypothetical protein